MNAIKKAINVLNAGGIIAYPTEAVYGLGCDPFNEQAVERLLTLKHRSIAKGLILIVANWEHVKSLIIPLKDLDLEKVKKSWPGHVTWVFPASQQVPHWIKGSNDTVALRMSAHPIAHQLTSHWGKPLVSTSANPTGSLPFRDRNALEAEYKNKIDYIVPGSLGEEKSPSPIRDVLSGKILRK